MTFVQPNGEQLGIIAQLIADGKIKPVVEQVIPLDKARYDHVCRCKAVILMNASRPRNRVLLIAGKRRRLLQRRREGR